METNLQTALYFTDFSLEEGFSGECIADFVEIVSF
jgi:hypothetical protein